MVFIGGIDKHEIAKVKQAIIQGLEKHLYSILGRGGCIPSLDHWIPTDISLNDYCYCRDKVIKCHMDRLFQRSPMHPGL
jgi:hypothetical protein